MITMQGRKIMLRTVTFFYVTIHTQGESYDYKNIFESPDRYHVNLFGE